MKKLITPVVFTDETGQHQVMTEGGSVLRCIMTQVTDEVFEKPVVLVKMYVRLATDRTAAEEMINAQTTE